MDKWNWMPPKICLSPPQNYDFVKFQHLHPKIPEVWSRFWSWSLVNILKLNFGQDFETKVWSRVRGWSLVEIQKLNCINLWHDLKSLNFKFNRCSYFGDVALNPWVCCSLGNVWNLSNKKRIGCSYLAHVAWCNLK